MREKIRTNKKICDYETLDFFEHFIKKNLSRELKRNTYILYKFWL